MGFVLCWLLVVYQCNIVISTSITVDVIGEITAVKSTVSGPPEDKNRVMATLELER